MASAPSALVQATVTEEACGPRLRVQGHSLSASPPADCQFLFPVLLVEIYLAYFPLPVSPIRTRSRRQHYLHRGDVTSVSEYIEAAAYSANYPARRSSSLDLKPFLRTFSSLHCSAFLI
jgi:hypothetical protein